ncbi:bifunctional adenosylcobinamide kinase/adenosylcobinamide-phosphate guanylyltransferase [Alkalicoccus daliensis]|uniref:Adenosylcobinamide kinase /adenosylcobinamide-phosphate guanylyltransferase n=1 Tax=Alkalicoccus daliensis TaxID=745820 RepID=A0A1H0HZC8_9BACI|nr:bifunctional adenosylcobinamide kinase/adenosylcobinamide-phosphate guanylyltransferase [Alkalicoccus daliensis]SDO24503.1 adenosylcobinamide kinase /adenosylcobinamide-phosphate guanylyltransferase [Alkalicoccus daliensis]
MHVVIGGAFAGKRAYIKELYPEAVWIEPGSNIHNTTARKIVITGIESWLRQGYGYKDFWNWLTQAGEKSNVILIIEEMGQGIVPIDKEERRLRDENGWISQRAVKEAAVVDYIWHGLAQRWKEE